jgi:hypothetical protein
MDDDTIVACDSERTLFYFKFFIMWRVSSNETYYVNY